MNGKGPDPRIDWEPQQARAGGPVQENNPFATHKRIRTLHDAHVSLKTTQDQINLCERAKFISREEAVDELRALQAEWEAARRFILAHGHLPPATPSGTSAAPFWERVASSTEAKQNSGPPSAPQQVVPVCEWPATAQTALDGDDSSHHWGEKLLQDTHGQFRQCILCLCKQRFGKHYGSNKYPGWQKLPEDALVCSSASGAAARQGAAAAAAGRDFVHRPVL
jgi:hypothetical protein